MERARTPRIGNKGIGKALILLVAVAPSGGGCYRGSATSVTPSHVGRESGWVIVENVRMVRQSTERDCGAAALAMVLGRWGIPSSTDEILRARPPAPGHGIPVVALRDFARDKGLAAFLIKGGLDDLSREVGLDRPVLVGLVQRVGMKAYPHYGVVIGINQSARRVLMLDPARDLREDTFEGFSTEWEAAGQVTLVVAAR